MAGNIFGRAAADTFGLSDIGIIVPPHEYQNTSGAGYVMHEDNERIYHIIQSKKCELVFTSYGLIYVEGESAVSKKRLVKRFNFFEKLVDNVMLETAGTVDLDIELKFTIGASEFSIDVAKRYMEELKDIYKALVEIGRLQKSNMKAMEDSEKSLQWANESFSRLSVNEDPIKLLEKMTSFNENWMKSARHRYSSRDFGLTFEKYINN